MKTPRNGTGRKAAKELTGHGKVILSRTDFSAHRPPQMRGMQGKMIGLSLGLTLLHIAATAVMWSHVNFHDDELLTESDKTSTKMKKLRISAVVDMRSFLILVDVLFDSVNNSHDAAKQWQ